MDVATLRMVAPRGRRDEILHALRWLAVPIRTHHGCAGCRILQDLDDENALGKLALPWGSGSRRRGAGWEIEIIHEPVNTRKEAASESLPDGVDIFHESNSGRLDLRRHD